MERGFWRRQWLRREARRTRREKGVPWAAILLVLLATVFFPTAVDIGIARVDPGYLGGLMWFIALWYTFASVMLLWEAFCARRLPSAPPEVETEALPMCSAIIAAYLPNEQDIILQTVLHMLVSVDVPPEKLQVLLAYNTPQALPVEKALRDLAANDPRLCLLHVEDSHSKAENVNAALGHVTGEIVAIFDADHLPEEHCFQKAWRWLSAGYQVVQGRCVIRNHDENWLTRLVAVEFDTIYAVSHQGRSNLSRTAIFGGSNGYWRRDALRAVGMNGAMLTEDIDSSVRTLLAGRRLIHDRSIRSFELAPTMPKHWFFQRKRWAQGWLEVSLTYQGALLRSRHLNGLQKLLWFYLLGWREIYPVFAMQFFPLVLAAWWVGRPLHWFHPGFFLATSLLNLTSGLFLLVFTSQCASREGRRGLGTWYVIYAPLNFLYTPVKAVVTLVAQYAHFTRDRAWVTTPRAIPPTVPGTVTSQHR